MVNMLQGLPAGMLPNGRIIELAVIGVHSGQEFGSLVNSEGVKVTPANRLALCVNALRHAAWCANECVSDPAEDVTTGRAWAPTD